MPNLRPEVTVMQETPARYVSRLAVCDQALPPALIIHRPARAIQSGSYRVAILHQHLRHTEPQRNARGVEQTAPDRDIIIIETCDTVVASVELTILNQEPIAATRIKTIVSTIY